MKNLWTTYKKLPDNYKLCRSIPEFIKYFTKIENDEVVSNNTDYILYSQLNNRYEQYRCMDYYKDVDLIPYLKKNSLYIRKM